jgi:shikimate dehydrogenase
MLPMSSPFDFDAPPDRYAVIGNPVSHSLSPRIHAAFARQTGQRMVYDAIQVDGGGFPQAVGNFQGAGGKGLNITLPFKIEAWRLADSRSPRAELAGAVNTMLFIDDRIHGDNTDGIGLVRDLTVNLGVTPGGRRVLVVGAGGAARGVIGPLLELQPAEIVIVNRTVDRAIELAGIFAGRGAGVSGCGFADLRDRAFDVIINGTSAGLHGDTLPLPPSVLAPGCWCYDMMYGREPTLFLRWAAAHGALGRADGLGMLVEQAAESFLLWRGVRPDTVPVRAELRSVLGH